MIKFDKPLLPPLGTPGSITKTLFIEEWLNMLKEKSENLIHHMEVKFKSKTVPVVRAHLFLFLDRICLNFSKGINRIKDFYFQRVNLVREDR